MYKRGVGGGVATFGHMATFPAKQTKQAVMRGFEDTPVNWSPVCIWTDDNGARQQSVQFLIPGVPIGQGNMITGRQGHIYDKTKGLRPWREMVTVQAKSAMRIRPHIAMRMASKSQGEPPQGEALQQFTGLVGLHVAFVLPRPRSAPKTRPVPAVKRPDLDKLMRAIGDSLTDAGVWLDDSQVVESHATKRVADYGESPGAHVLVTSSVYQGTATLWHMGG